MSAKTLDLFPVNHDPLTDEAVDGLIVCMKEDFKDSYDTMVGTTSVETEFDMFEPDNWELMAMAVDDIQNYINDLRNCFMKSKHELENKKRGLDYWKDRCETSSNDKEKTIDHWRRKHDVETTSLKTQNRYWKDSYLREQEKVSDLEDKLKAAKEMYKQLEKKLAV